MPILKAYRSYVAQSLDYDTAIEDYFTHYLKIDDAAQIAAVNSELHDFIFEDDISVDYITDADVGLYYTVQYFKYINTIPYDININLVDILSNSNYQRDWDNVCNLGTYITVQNPETEEYQKVRLLSYTHSPEDNQLDLTFGNQEELKDALNTLTKNIWQYTMRVAEKAQDYINMYDNVIKEAADLLGIELPDTNYDYSVSIDNSTKNYTNVYGNNSSTPTTTPPSTTTNNSTTNNYNTNVKISSIKGNALVSLSDGLYVPDLTSPSYGGTGTSTGSNTNTGTGGSTVDTKHVILSSMPTQEQINNYADETIVLIYDVSNVYIEDTTT
jgi:type II secretory pathway pseudopilin PulG